MAGTPTTETSLSQHWFYCRMCGLARRSDVAPWCRHNDPERKMPAGRMIPMPAYHPLAKE